MFSDMERMKTEIENSTEIPSEIFSPWSGEDMNVNKVSEDNIAHGRIRFNVKKRCRRMRLIVAAICKQEYILINQSISGSFINTTQINNIMKVHNNV